MAASTRSFGIFTAFAFCITVRSLGLFSGLGPLCFTAMAISLPIRVNCFAMRSKRANMVCFRFSKILPISICKDTKPPWTSSRKKGGRPQAALPSTKTPKNQADCDMPIDTCPGQGNYPNPFPEIKTDTPHSHSHSYPLHSSHWQNTGNANPTNSQWPYSPSTLNDADTPL